MFRIFLIFTFLFVEPSLFAQSVLKKRVKVRNKIDFSLGLGSIVNDPYRQFNHAKTSLLYYYTGSKAFGVSLFSYQNSIKEGHIDDQYPSTDVRELDLGFSLDWVLNSYYAKQQLFGTTSIFRTNLMISAGMMSGQYLEFKSGDGETAQTSGFESDGGFGVTNSEFGAEPQLVEYQNPYNAGFLAIGFDRSYFIGKSFYLKPEIKVGVVFDSYRDYRELLSAAIATGIILN